MRGFRNTGLQVHTLFSIVLQGKFCDVTVGVVDDSGERGNFNLHRIILAGSSGFFRQAFENTDEKDVVVVMDPKIFESCLSFIYAGHAIVGQDEVGPLVGVVFVGSILVLVCLFLTLFHLEHRPWLSFYNLSLLLVLWFSPILHLYVLSLEGCVLVEGS